MADSSVMFARKDFPTIMSGLVVRYQITSEPYTAEINASREGVSISGTWPVMDAESTVLVGETLARARIHAQHLSRYARIHLYDFRSDVYALSEDEVTRRLNETIPVYEAS